MNFKKYHLITILIILLLVAGTAFAQATRTWVSGVGDDANPCSRTAPCKTFAGAISKTAANGEISVLDPGGFGAVTVTKGMTIDGNGQVAGILNAGTNGVTINAGVNDEVILRNISINGGGTGLNGIRYLAGKRVTVDNVAISGFNQNGIDVSLSTNGNLNVSRTRINGGTNGIRINTSSGRVNANVADTIIVGSTNAIDTVSGLTEVRDSILSQSSGVGALSEGTSVLSLVRCTVSQNATGIIAQGTSTIRIISSSFFDNLLGFGCGTGNIASANNNFKAGNVGGMGMACVPNQAITIQ